MSTDRQRPEFGEYATPAEQQAAIRASGGRMPEPAAQEVHEAKLPMTRPVLPEATGAGLANRFFTVMLLAVGVISVFQSAPGYLALGDTVQTLYTQQSIGDYKPTELTAVLGVVALVLHGLIWAATAYFAVRLLMRGKQSWWVPLVGAVVGIVAVSIVISVLLLGDPAFIDYITSAAVPG
ncbi:DUF6264 family protein [Cryobacterium sp. BB736]|uniref:DUF6264 family protein n=1 Tax=Cryobacterium sp. BB736 TaxID=2746963 RepID=UPI00187475CF|nr:DUF6264 family protein [Cryobacterium sp. BB736]